MCWFLILFYELFDMFFVFFVVFFLVFVLRFFFCKLYPFYIKITKFLQKHSKQILKKKHKFYIETMHILCCFFKQMFVHWKIIKKIFVYVKIMFC